MSFRPVYTAADVVLSRRTKQDGLMCVGSLDVSSELHLMSGDILEMTLWYFETPYNFFINLPAVNEL